MCKNHKRKFLHKFAEFEESMVIKVMKFTKMQGCGNDYVCVNGFAEKLETYLGK